MSRRVGANFLHAQKSHLPVHNIFSVHWCFKVAFGLPISCSTLMVGIFEAKDNDINRLINRPSRIVSVRVHVADRTRGRTSSETSRLS